MYVILHDKRGFACVVKDLEKNNFFFALSGWIQYNNKGPYKWETIVSESEEGLKTEAGVRVRENLRLHCYL